MRNRSKKRARQERQYAKDRVTFIEEQRDDKDRIFCIFCGGEIYGEPSLHHALGRDEDLLLDTRYWYLSHNRCHVDEYHSLSIDKLPWWEQYLQRLIDRGDTIVYLKELKKIDKS